MAKINPLTVAAVLLVLMVMASTIFFFAVPDSLQNDSESLSITHLMNKVGYWGPPTSEVDWCELNHIHTIYVTELFNSTTSFYYVFIALYAYYKHKEVLDFDSTSVRHQTLLLMLAIVGFGSVAFHGTLQYYMQLLDEIPMIYLILTAAWILTNRRSTEPTRGGMLIGGIYIGACILLTLVLLTTAQHSGIHNFFRGSGVVTFVVHLVYTFYSSSLAIAEVAKTDEKAAAYMSQLFVKGFAAICIALVCWISDNIFCQTLLGLPLPFFLNLHAFGWHIGTAMSVYYMYCAMLVQRVNIIRSGDSHTCIVDNFSLFSVVQLKRNKSSGVLLLQPGQHGQGSTAGSDDCMPEE